MGESLIEIDDKNFVTEVLECPSIVLVHFWAEGFAPCSAVGATIEKLASDVEGNVRFGRLDIRNNPTTANEYDINSIPAVVIFSRGQIIDTFVGVRPYERYLLAIKQSIAHHRSE